MDSRVSIEKELRNFDFQLEVRRMIVKRFIEQRESVYFSLEMKIYFSIEILQQMRKMVDLFGVAFGVRFTHCPHFLLRSEKIKCHRRKKQTSSKPDSIFNI